jgi:hypothetical protein
MPLIVDHLRQKKEKGQIVDPAYFIETIWSGRMY